ncbi:MAG: ribosomal-protein-alanine N-acetyltransferase, partial [Thermodesulfovibrionia bacterium]|nr:ribosomal-protein-alanine N-acetyltransferase [Thermodesulfovibrionia bacterium]
AFIIKESHRIGVENVFLEVRKSNYQAIRLYQKFEFIQIGLRKKYYQQPVEDALLFQLKLS